MNHGMAVWANWYKIPDGIQLVGTPTLMDGDDVMHLDESLSPFTVLFSKVEAADAAYTAFDSYAFFPGFRPE